MTLRENLTSTRAIRAASLIIIFAGFTGCERAKSPPGVDSTQSATQAPASGSQPSSARGVPEATSETMRAFAAAHLRPGLKPGDFLTKKADYPTGDTADVYRAVLDTLYVSKDGFPGQVVLYDAAMTGVVTCTRMPCPILPFGTTSEPKTETLDAYRIARLNRRHITPKFTYHIPLKLMGETEQREIEIDGRAIAVRDSAAGRRSGMREMPYWLGFQARYPHAWGYAVLSVVGMNPKKTEAILQVMHRCGTYCHSTETMVLWKVRGQWHVIERVPEEGDSTDLGNESLRYRGVGVHTPLNEIRESRRRDSIRQAEVPRDIHGTITESVSRRPLVGATLTLHTDENPNVPSARIATDSYGRYRFDKPPVGGAGIMVRCPASSRRPDTLMAVTAVDVKPGKQFQFDMLLNGGICDDSTYRGSFQSIMAPFDAPPMQNNFDSDRALKAKYPSDEEAAIYRILLENMSSMEDGQMTLVYATTRSACKSSTCKDDYMRRIRYEPRVMLSAMENFLLVHEQQLDLKGGLPLGPTASLVGDSAIAGLERAAGRGGVLDNFTLLHKGWPTVGRVVSFSRIGFSPNHVQAIVEVIRSDDDARRVQLWILNRIQNGWNIVRWFDE